MSPEFGLNIPLLAYRVEEARPRSDTELLIQQARPVGRRRLSPASGQWRSRLGRRLVALGQRLEAPAIHTAVHKGGNEPCIQS